MWCAATPVSTSSACRTPDCEARTIPRFSNGLLTHDVTTMTRFAYARVAAGRQMPGLFEIGTDLPLARAIDDVLLIAECSVDGEWEGQIMLRRFRTRSTEALRSSMRLRGRDILGP